MQTTIPLPADSHPATRHWGRTALLYLGLVGLPAVGVAGIVRLGDTLTPPLSVGGRWTLAAAPAAVAAIPELANGADGGAPTLVIVQSGVRLAVNLGDAGPSTANATIEGNRLRAALARNGEPRLAIDGLVTKEGATPRLAGELRRGDCPTCPAVSFTAERVAGPRG